MNKTHYELAALALKAFIHGTVLHSGEDAYDETRRVWNKAGEKHPLLIVQAACASDVIAAVTFAREHGLPVAVRSGGHSMAGHGSVEDGIVIDLSGMKGMEIDPVRRVARLEPGLTWGEVARVAERYGLGLTSGDMGTVGVGGLVLGGGIGWFVRKHGLTIDNLLSVEIVTADGRLVHASADENPELFWGLRGGGGNFGIATAFEFKLHPAGTILGGVVIYDAADAEDVLREAARYADGAPDEFTVMATLMTIPPLPFVPPEKHFTEGIVLMLCYAGSMEEGERVAAPLRTLAQPIADVIAPMPYTGLFAITAPGGELGNYHHLRSMYFPAVDEESLAAVVREGRTKTPGAMVQLRILGGAMSRVPADATAFAHRDKRVMVTITDHWTDPSEAAQRKASIERIWNGLRPYASGVYMNFLADEGEERVREAYSPQTYARLAALKNRYDPTNLFALNQNIAPGEVDEIRKAA